MIRLLTLADLEGRRFARACLASALLIGASAAGHALAREASAGFAVKVHLLGSAHASDAPKAAGSATPAISDAPSSLHELKVSLPTRAGYYVRFEIVDPAVQLVEIHEPGRVIPLASGARMFVPQGREAITYRMKLRPGAQLSEGAAVRVTLQP